MTATSKTYLLALGLWPLFLVTAVSLGAIREKLIVPALGEQPAHVIGTFLFIAFLLVIIWMFVSRISKSVHPVNLWLIGLTWTAMTVCFEFGFFHFVMGVPWENLVAEYNIFADRLWLLVPLATLFGPPLIHSLSSRFLKENKEPT